MYILIQISTIRNNHLISDVFGLPRINFYLNHTFPSKGRLIRVLQVKDIVLLLITRPKHSDLLLEAVHQLPVDEQEDAVLLSQPYILLQQSISDGAYQVTHLVVDRRQEGHTYSSWDLAVFVIGLEADEHRAVGLGLFQLVLSVLDALLNGRKELFEGPMAEFYFCCLCGLAVHCK